MGRNKRASRVALPVNRVEPDPESAATSPVNENVKRVMPNPVSAKGAIGGHWSSCPECGASKLSITPIHTPVCRATGDRCESGIVNYMRCRQCGKNYKSVRPD